ncbi:XRE family transcriptional regulator (plasmid) [Calothrix sp. NIES-4071]|nr:XRE family transcriptional regulator [Calothrix sp. NIES-4071]BAZ64648.1 XRE family transcriptional regulator [Calothrix sp. NIES-4105]
MTHNLITKQPEIGQFIREVRLLTGLTQEQFAAAVGVTYPTVNRWENARAKPSPMAIKLIEKMLVDLGDKSQDLLAKYSIK